MAAVSLRHAVLILAAIVAQPALAQDAMPQSVPSAPNPETNERADAADAPPAPFVPAILDADGRKLVSASNAFSLDMLRKIASPDQNLVISPASVSLAVGFAYRGAVGQTATELQKVMHYPFAPVQNLAAGKGLLDSLEIQTPQRELHAANAIWTQEGMPFDASFEGDLARYAKSAINRFNLKGEPDSARQTVNRWVAGKTRDKIPELIGRGMITKYTRAVLVNALYLKAAWAMPFAPAATRQEDFKLADGALAKVQLMTLRSPFKVASRKGVKSILIPFVGGELSLVVFLPDNPKALARFEAGLTGIDLEAQLAKLDAGEFRDTILSLPRFSLKWQNDIKGQLEAMGAPLAFSDEADFSGMAKLPYPGGDPAETGLKISHVIHAATLDVDEEGSEASAATAVIMSIVITGSRGRPPPPPPFIFRADKPFLFALRDNRTGLLLFVGHYVRPELPAP